MSYHGDIAEDTTDYNFKFTSRNTTGQPHALVSGDIDIYRGGTTDPTTSGATLTSTFNDVVGLNFITINLNASTFYSAGSNYSVVMSAGTVNSVSIIGETVNEFSIDNRAVSSGTMLTIATTALETYGATTLGTTEFVDAATTALETHGVSTHTSTDVFDQSKNAITTLSVASTADLATALSNYGGTTLSTTEFVDAATTALETHGASTITSTDVDDSLTSYGASTLGSTELKDITTTALEDFGVSTHTTTDVFDQAKNAITTLSVASTADLDNSLSNYGATTLGTTEFVDANTTALETHGASTITTTNVTDVLINDGLAEVSSAPASSASVGQKINWQFALSRNKGLQTATLKTLRNDADSADIATAVVSATTAVFTREEFS